MNIKLHPAVSALGALFGNKGARLFAVGGMVRNAILGFPLSDFDICSSLTPQEAIELLKDENIKVIPKAIKYGTLEIHFIYEDKMYPFELTTFRKDIYGKGGNHRPEGVIFSKDINDDAIRRDFTINALYADAITGEIIDPTGGLADIENNLIRAASKDPSIILRDDGLRLLRLVRFACELGFDIEKKTFECAKQNSSLIKDIPNERIWVELKKIVLSDIRYGAHHAEGLAHYRGIKLMDELGLIEHIIPELLEGKEIKQRIDYHAYDVYEHLLHAFECSAPVLSVRLAALLHDIGKPRTFIKTGKMLFHDKMGEEIAEEILTRLIVPSALKQRICILIRWHMLDLDGNAKEETLRKHFARLGKEASYELALVREADFVGSGYLKPPIITAERFKKTLIDMEKKNAPFSLEDLDITGEQIMQVTGLNPSKAVGELKKSLFKHCVKKPQDNKFNKLNRLVMLIHLSRASAPNIERSTDDG